MKATACHVDAPPLEARTHHSLAVERWRDGVSTSAIDQVADEVPVAMVYNGISHVVMLATPASLESFGLGFSLTEGILQDRSELYGIEVAVREEGVELQMAISQERFFALKQRRRNLAGRTGCGLCGTESLQQVRRPLPPVASLLKIPADVMQLALSRLPEGQALQALTGAVHAAAWADAAGNLLAVEEDIGRHNALDKLIGTLSLRGTDFANGFAIVTSRASYEMAQKCVTVGIPLLMAVSAPTRMAIGLAEESGLTLVGFARGGRHVAYAHPERIQPMQAEK